MPENRPTRAPVERNGEERGERGRRRQRERERREKRDRKREKREERSEREREPGERIEPEGARRGVASSSARQ